MNKNLLMRLCAFASLASITNIAVTMENGGTLIPLSSRSLVLFAGEDAENSEGIELALIPYQAHQPQERPDGFVLLPANPPAQSRVENDYTSWLWHGTVSVASTLGKSATHAVQKAVDFAQSQEAAQAAQSLKATTSLYAGRAACLASKYYDPHTYLFNEGTRTLLNGVNEALLDTPNILKSLNDTKPFIIQKEPFLNRNGEEITFKTALAMAKERGRLATTMLEEKQATLTAEEMQFLNDIHRIHVLIESAELQKLREANAQHLAAIGNHAGAQQLNPVDIMHPTTSRGISGLVAASSTN